MRLDELRSRIDSLDADIVKLLSARAEAAQQVGREKREHGIEIRDPTREEDVLTTAAARCETPLGEEGVRSIYREIIDVCSQIQADLDHE